MERKNLTIVGGGSTYTLGILMSLIEEKVTFPLKSIRFYDIDSERQRFNAEAAKILLQELYPEVEEVIYTTNKEVAFTGADVLFLQIRTGGLEMREKDEQIALSHGCVGQETCGAGGMAYGLRSIGDMITLVKDIRQYAPEAWILNYTNPAAIVAEATTRVFPDDKKLINMCDMPCIIMESYADMLGCELWDLVPEYFGLNHYGWFTRILHRNGEDLTQKIKDCIINQGFSATSNFIANEPSWQETFKNMQTMLKDNPEFLPNTYLQYYLYPQKMVAKEDINNTRARQVIDGREKEMYTICKDIIDSGTAANANLESDTHGVYMIRVAESVVFNKGYRYLSIVKNNGIISNLQDDAMVEVPASLYSDGVKPYAIGEIPTFQKAMIESQLGYEKLVVDAWFEGSRQKLINALTLNRTVINVPTAIKIVDDVLAANKAYLPQFFNDNK
ncbi:6-phospho-alpha-glucosidase [Photobacterium kishitanii]|uniref:6-phospho-alpha-glucosidase n=1 Tax=Photobacterium kishitanii TaxID=318456 RepID=A0AAX0YYH7_9GAMM|nr:6-phospho-alpha-glucosidase [Photobacterium kishitanii]KJG11187.1 6-phospho-alpha-glucosidase [Photobacterium kishitanii]KJG58718.1 6-phospho-alpha-glucosidase [Photobacterium kishitanii]KJG62751.1 6-phospho-alpha-glucosidase [Photobacterium kishitanii]KJG66652.1 6-phospho-alpha-glucosidase [Photobacterium kishitanii]KJG70993.1 6-phospho-alpha-glucosidase [Photobacterium kishitanii]